MAVKDYTGQMIETLRMFRPDIRPIDFSNVLDNFNNAYDKAYNKSLNNAYSDALASGDEERASKIAAMLDPAGERAMKQALKQREEDRQWALEDKANAFAQQKELLGMRLANSMALENMRNQNARNLAEFKAGLGGIATQNPFEKKRIEKAAAEMDANISRAQEMKATFEQANNALQNINTGTPLAMFTKNKPLFSNADEETFDSAAAKSIDMVRKAGTGPMTDADARRYEKASIDRGKSKEANQLLIDSGIIAADNAIAREELRAQWVANGGSISSFDTQWRNYINKNPIFSNKDGKLNKNRKNAYDWFTNPQPSLKQFNSGGYVKVKAPDGRVVNVPESELENALSQGGQRI